MKKVVPLNLHHIAAVYSCRKHLNKLSKAIQVSFQGLLFFFYVLAREQFAVSSL